MVDEATIDKVSPITHSHVRIGNHWYRHLCRERGLDPLTLYPELVERYEAPRLRPPFNVEARSAAGFSDEEIAYLSS